MQKNSDQASVAVPTSSAGNGPSKPTMLESKRARSVIDKLRELGLGAKVSLPQIAVCGDTSTGKSSVLSALSTIAFPADVALKTRCPTQVSMTAGNPGDKSSVYVSIQFVEPLPDESEKEIRELREKKLVAGGLRNVGGTIDALMSRLKSLRGGADVFADTICIDVTDPSVPNLTLIDLPGLVRTTTKDFASQAMIKELHSLVKRYLNEPRTVILAVIQSTVDIHNAGILTDALEADPKGERTIGVLTMPDRVEAASAPAVEKVLLNRTKSLTLGWHMVRLRSQEHLNQGTSPADFLPEEAKYFAEKDSPWARCPAESKGITNLGMRLERLLDERIRASLPALVKEVSETAVRLREEIQVLGESVADESSRRLVFSRTVNRVAALLEAAVNGQYASDTEFFGNVAFRIRAQTRQREEKFRDELQARVPYEGIEWAKGDRCEWRLCNEFDDSLGEWTDGKIVEVRKDSCYLNDTKDKPVKDCRGNYKTIPFRDIRPPRSNLLQQLRDARGRELPSFLNFDVFRVLVADVIKTWRKPTESLFSEVLALVNETVKAIVAKNVPKSLPALHQFIAHRLDELLQKQSAELGRALDAELGQHGEQALHTLNHYFTDELIKLRNVQLEDRLKALVPKGQDNDSVSLGAVLAVINAFGVGKVSNEEYEVIEMEFRLAAYVKVARKRFLDNVQSLLEMHLLGPVRCQALNIFNGVSDSNLADILNEDSLVVERRRRVTADHALFQQAATILREFIGRTASAQ